MNETHQKDNISEAMADREGILRAMRQAAQIALAQHKIANFPVVVMRDGEIAWIKPEDIEVPGSIVMVVRLATEIFKDRQIVIDWLCTPNSALGGLSPSRLFETDEGADMVLTLLDRRYR